MWVSLPDRLIQTNKSCCEGDTTLVALNPKSRGSADTGTRKPVSAYNVGRIAVSWLRINFCMGFTIYNLQHSGTKVSNNNNSRQKFSSYIFTPVGQKVMIGAFCLDTYMTSLRSHASVGLHLSATISMHRSPLEDTWTGN